jgi:N-acyl-D-aspartate/D-glutamate deacylase
VHHLTDAPARLYGLVDRGRVAEGAWADLFLFAPYTLGPGPLETRYDLPAGAGRIYGEALGIDRVFVAGVEVVSGKEFTDARPGRVLRTSPDTVTVSAH